MLSLSSSFTPFFLVLLFMLGLLLGGPNIFTVQCISFEVGRSHPGHLTPEGLCTAKWIRKPSRTQRETGKRAKMTRASNRRDSLAAAPSETIRAELRIQKASMQFLEDSNMKIARGTQECPRPVNARQYLPTRRAIDSDNGAF
ncbi:hypothetical protein BDZ89DRAFT_1053133 [Hymenopellis radicata]|nr:hypothetical protein BDZ89DRAFT_1053133 [Hymenopellis radicata]